MVQRPVHRRAELVLVLVLQACTCGVGSEWSSGLRVCGLDADEPLIEHVETANSCTISEGDKTLGDAFCLQGFSFGNFSLGTTLMKMGIASDLP